MASAASLPAKDLFKALPAAFQDQFMQQWLCACAVFPGLRFALTVQLGRVVADRQKRDWPDESSFLVLTRLPWFREGRMPEEVRFALLGRLDQNLKQPVRAAIEELVYNALEAPALLDAPDFKRPPASWHHVFRGFLGSRRGSSQHYDVIYRQFMLGYRPGQLDLRLDGWARRHLGERFSALLDWRSLAAGLASIALGIILFVFPYDVGEPVETIESQPKTAVITEFTDRLADGSPCPICPPMVALPAGSFVMGSPLDEEGREDDEGPQHQVDVPAFAIGQYEVTVGEYRVFVESTKRTQEGCYAWGIKGSAWGFQDDNNWRNPGFDQNDGQPVTCISWEDAKAYAAWLSEATGRDYRLPSEAEWAYASRAGTRTSFYWSAMDSPLCRFANGYDLDARELFMEERGSDCRDGHVFTAPVGSYPANAFGLYDISGNVWEWVEDRWHDNYDGAPQDGSPWLEGNDSMRVLRGGAWINNPDNLRAAYRSRNVPVNRNYNVGFRLSRTLTP